MTNTMPDVVLPSYYVRQVAYHVEVAQRDVVGWLAGVGLNRAQLDDMMVSMSFQQFRALLLNAITLTQEPALGLLIGSRLFANTHGTLGYAAMNSVSIRQFITLFEQFIALRTTLVKVSHQEYPERFEVHFEPAIALGDVFRPVLEAVVLAIKNMLDYVTIGACAIEQVVFTCAGTEADTRLAVDLFHAPVCYQATWTGFVVPLALVDQPLKMADPIAFNNAADICRKELAKMSLQVSMTARVKRLMLEQQQGFPSLQVTARLFYLTPRTLHRRLLEEGTSFQQILEEVRHTLAIEHLKAGRLSIQEIAYLLGYAELSNFRRAFKRWEGIAPSQYRGETHHGGSPLD